MKKSKFLKKSLAMLLALMLVVAMIPLSASAAQTQPALNYLYVNDLTVANENGTFEVDAHYESTGATRSLARCWAAEEVYVLELKPPKRRKSPLLRTPLTSSPTPPPLPTALVIPLGP